MMQTKFVSLCYIMGYALDVLISIPLGILFFVLATKLISYGIASNDQRPEGAQKRFVIGFIVGLLMLVISVLYFSDNKKWENKSVNLGLYEAGSLLVVCNIVINWDKLDEITKIILITVLLVGTVLYSYDK